ncbi:hypothetical protein [Streptomyces sp. NPDC059142]|uniref:hypothetical protein n=1 Tax=Streptomyces sp. NPDC059142 TaxID=3346739 RepID=UPI0036D160C6
MSGQNAPQGSHFYVMTLEKPGVLTAMRSGTFTPRPGTTRYDAFSEIYELITSANRDLYRANVVHFAIESNHL